VYSRSRPVWNVGIAKRFPRTRESGLCFPSVRHFHRLWLFQLALIYDGKGCRSHRIYEDDHTAWSKRRWVLHGGDTEWKWNEEEAATVACFNEYGNGPVALTNQCIRVEEENQNSRRRK
jgi:hypothetical protein